MSPADVISMAREAGFGPRDSDLMQEELGRFATLAAAAEREACAQVCDALYGENWGRSGDGEICAKTIRARGQS